MTDSPFPPDAPPRLALFGGAFDPPHVGHVLAVHYILLTSSVQRVLVVPCARHPFASSQHAKGNASFEDRLAMCRLAFIGSGERIQVLDIEARRPGPSYTIDTVRDLKRLYSEWEIEVVIGSDNLAEFGRWKDAAELRVLAGLRVLPRLEEQPPAGSTSVADTDRAASGSASVPARNAGEADPHDVRAGTLALPVGHLPFCLPRVSSSMVRGRLASGADVSPLVPREVLAYIQNHRLYGQEPQG